MGLFTPRRQQQRAITAASTTPNGTLQPPAGGAPTPGMMAEAWQLQAWAFCDMTGPLTFAATFRANMYRQIRLYAGVRPDDNPDGDPIPIDDILDPEKEASAPDGVPLDLIQQAQIELARIRSATDGQQGILADVGFNWTVAGDCRLVVEPDSNEVNGERWQVYSVTELSHSGAWPDGSPRWTSIGPPSRVLAPGTFAFRIYTPHPNRHTRAHSSVLGILGDLEEYHLIQRSFRGIAKSRVSGAGMLIMPDELDFPSSDPDNPDAPSQFEVDMVKHMSTPLRDEDDASNIVPFLVRGPNDLIGPNSVRHIAFTRPADVVMDTREDKKLRSMAIGLDTPPEIILGIGDVSHWGAWAVSESSWKQHGEPGMIQLCGQLGALPLRALLTAHGTWTPGQIAQIVVAYDPTNLLDHPDRGKDALSLYQEFELSGDSLRGANNFDDADRPTADEVAARIERQRLIHSRGAPVEFIDPRYTTAPGEDPHGPNEAPLPLYPVGQVPAPGTTPAKAAQPVTPATTTKGPPSATRPTSQAPPARVASAAPTAANAGRPVGTKLAALDLALYARVHGMAQAAVRRQLEKAGARITSKVARNKTAADVAKAAPKHRVAAALGQPMVAALGLADDELTGDYTDLLDEVDSQVSRTRAAGLAALLAYAKAHGQTLSDAQVAEYLANAESQQTQGRTQLGQALAGFTAGLLYQPDPAADLQGEGVAAGDVPPGLIRSALATYGGQDLGPDGRPSVPGQPLQGVAGGGTNLGAGAQLGLSFGLWQWQVGAPEHPFEPHQELEGEIFDDGADIGPDDPRFNTDYAWLNTTSYFPGDHGGCQCSASYLLSYDQVTGGDS